MIWTDRPAVSTMRLPDGSELAVVEWASCWGWHIDPTPSAPIHEGKPFLAQGRAESREKGKIAAETAFQQMLK